MSVPVSPKKGGEASPGVRPRRGRGRGQARGGGLSVLQWFRTKAYVHVKVNITTW